MLALPVLVTPAVELSLFGLDTEVKTVLGRQRVPHPYVLAVFECLVFVSSGGDAVKSQLSEQR